MYTRNAHNTNDSETETDNYKIYFAKTINENDNNKGIWGFSITIRKNLTNEITNIRRTSGRNMSIIIETSKKTNIRILNTYAPHMGYDNGERTKYRKEINTTLNENKNDDCIIWRTGNNGQISNEEGDNVNTSIGKRTYSNKTEKAKVEN